MNGKNSQIKVPTFVVVLIFSRLRTISPKIANFKEYSNQHS